MSFLFKPLADVLPGDELIFARDVRYRSATVFRILKAFQTTPEAIVVFGYWFDRRGFPRNRVFPFRLREPTPETMTALKTYLRDDRAWIVPACRDPGAGR
ncbi:hypothetical protein [Limnoglobus roseus]|uniref:Uncharacterized protein n=1 Tax=Limnoglobus roseus TaxID=2598579 RepID=A0A5C1AS21_9BACT|nr:hypothetical protein [Limnoglobus roseus]QEL20502.1 hypothetical protein PX52LOC_07606 [Limnoglobus roseus]